MKHSIHIYCDGSCIGNPGIGSSAALIVYKSNIINIITKNKIYATNNQMELQAAIISLLYIKNQKIYLYSDSIYLINGIKQWLLNWKYNNFTNTNKKPIKNQSMWLTLYNLNNNNIVIWRWIKAHCGNINNEKINTIAKTSACTTKHFINIKY